MPGPAADARQRPVVDIDMENRTGGLERVAVTEAEVEREKLKTSAEVRVEEHGEAGGHDHQAQGSAGDARISAKHGRKRNVKKSKSQNRIPGYRRQGRRPLPFAN